MFQKIIESHNNIHTLDNGALITGLEVDLMDEETFAASESVVRDLLKAIPEQNVVARFYLKSSFCNETPNSHSRSKALSHVGFVALKAYLIFELQPKVWPLKFKTTEISKDAESLTQLLNLPSFKAAGLECKTLSAKDIEEICPKLQEEIHHKFQTVDTGSELLSLLRLTKQSEFGISPSTLSLLKDSLLLPYLISVSIKPITQASSETLLRRRSKQNSVGEDLKDARKFSEAQSDLEDISLNGLKLYQMEWLCLINRSQEDWLRTDREDFKNKLQGLGEIYLESVGALESLKALYPGGGQHFTMIEKDEVLPCYIPLTSRGDGKTGLHATFRSLALHRRDDTITAVDIFNPTYESFSWCIFGRPGTGKSVLVNAITRALANDPNIKIIKIDVGGSHSRETEMLGGVEKTLSLNEPTGINPFEILEDLGASKEAIQILASFIEVLILEENETKLSKSFKSELENILQEFADGRGPFSLDGFYHFAKNLPRRNLLARWVGNGVYGNAFTTNKDSSNSEPDLLDHNLIYFNFAKISQAQDPDYAQGGLAAVMAKFNYEMLKKSEHKKRIVFIADETPFFIQKCFNFFNLSIANIRKEGHGFITVAQKSSHVVVAGDTAILDNSPNKIFFSLDGDEQSFKARTQLDEDAVAKIQSLQRRNGEFSECLLKDQKGERVLKIRLSPEEYWAYTSKDEDKRKFQELRNSCPSLRLEEVIRCLSL